jgi:hypothetical protein
VGVERDPEQFRAVAIAGGDLRDQVAKVPVFRQRALHEVRLADLFELAQQSEKVGPPARTCVTGRARRRS